MANRISRKNPFGQATAYNGPQRQENSHFNSEISEDPSFQDVSNSHSGWNQPKAATQNRSSNPYGTTREVFASPDDYSDFNPPNIKSIHSSQPAFSNSGWATGPQTPAAFGQYNQEQPMEYKKSPYPGSGAYGESQMYGQQEEPPLLEGKFFTVSYHKSPNFHKNSISYIHPYRPWN